MRWVAGFLVGAAGLLKAAELVFQPVLERAPDSHFYLLAQSAVEVLLGLLVLSGYLWRTLQWHIALLFAGFACFSLYLAVNGASSCGCFGPVHFNPWWTFGLDAAVSIGLLVSAFLSRLPERESIDSGESRYPRLLRSFPAFMPAAMSAFVIVVAMVFHYADGRIAVGSGISSTREGLVVLEPEKWVNQKLPIADFIDENLSSGEWIAVLHRHDCPVCQEAIRRYDELASGGHRIALIEVPPYGHSTSVESVCRRCRLVNDREWFVQTPMEIRLQDGIVLAVKSSHVE